MSRGEELFILKESYRTREVISRILGSISLGFGASTIAAIAHNGGGPLAPEAVILGISAGTGLLSYAGSIGHRANVIDAELHQMESAMRAAVDPQVEPSHPTN